MPLIRKPGAAPPSQPSTDDAREALGAPSADLRWSAARQLGRKPGDAGILAEALAGEGDARVREALFTGLARDASPEAVGAILSFLRSPDAGLRTGAMDSLAMIPQAIETNIEKLLADADPDVRILSCDLARRLPLAVANRHLAALLERETVPNVCGAAIEVLSEVGDETVLPALHACANRFAQEGFLAYAIQLAIQQVGENGRPSRSAPA